MITIYEWFGYELPVTERYKMIKRAGFDGVSIGGSMNFERYDFPDNPPSAREAGLFIEYFHAPFDGRTEQPTGLIL